MWWLFLVLYLAVWVASGIIAAKGLAFGNKPDFEEAILGSLMCLFWPLLIIPGIVWLITNREPKEEPKSATLTPYELYRLEQEAGLKPDDNLYDKGWGGF